MYIMRGKFSSKNHAIIVLFSYSLKPIIYFMRLACESPKTSILILMVNKNKRGLLETEDLTFIVLIKIILIILSFFSKRFAKL